MARIVPAASAPRLFALGAVVMLTILVAAPLNGHAGMMAVIRAAQRLPGADASTVWGAPGPAQAVATQVAAHGVINERVLITVFAQTRAWRLTWPGFKKHVLDSLVPSAPGNVDLALCVRADEANTTGNPFYAAAKHIWTYPDPPEFDWGVAFDYIKQTMNASGDWRVLMHLPSGHHFLGGVNAREGENAHITTSSALVIFYRWYLLHNLRTEGLLDKYDRFILTRSDFFYAIPHPPLSALCPDFVWLPDASHWGGIVDRHGVIPRKHIESWLDQVTEIMTDPDALAKDLIAAGYTFNNERLIRFIMDRRGVRPLETILFYPMASYMVRHPDESSRWGAGAWNEEAQAIVKYPTEYSSFKQYKDVLTSNEAWVRYIANRTLTVPLTKIDEPGNLPFMRSEYPPCQV